MKDTDLELLSKVLESPSIGKKIKKGIIKPLFTHSRNLAKGSPGL
jgi:hypothetical protein